MQENDITGIPVTDPEDNKLVGILTNRDVRFVTDTSILVSDIMTKEDLITVRENITPEEAKKTLHANRIEKLLVTDESGCLVGLMTVKDLEKAGKHPNAAKDSRGVFVLLQRHLLVKQAFAVLL